MTRATGRSGMNKEKAMETKENYEVPEMEITIFEGDDIVTTSFGDDEAVWLNIW